MLPEGDPYTEWKTTSTWILNVAANWQCQPGNAGVGTWPRKCVVKMDWCGSPGSKFNCDETIIEHWLSHVKEWEVFCNSHKEALFVHYEDLIENPFEVYLSIRNIFFKHSALMESNELDVISKPLGLLPNAGTSNSWNNKYTDTDLEKFTTLIPTEYQNRFFTK